MRHYELRSALFSRTSNCRGKKNIAFVFIYYYYHQLLWSKNVSTWTTHTDDLFGSPECKNLRHHFLFDAVCPAHSDDGVCGWGDLTTLPVIKLDERNYFDEKNNAKLIPLILVFQPLSDELRSFFLSLQMTSVREEKTGSFNPFASCTHSHTHTLTHRLAVYHTAPYSAAKPRPRIDKKPKSMRMTNQVFHRRRLSWLRSLDVHRQQHLLASGSSRVPRRLHWVVGSRGRRSGRVCRPGAWRI